MSTCDVLPQVCYEIYTTLQDIKSQICTHRTNFIELSPEDKGAQPPWSINGIAWLI